MSLSVVVHTKNAAETLRRALKSVTFADEIIIIDMESTDGTPLIAQDFTEEVHNHVDVGFADPARNFGLSKATSDWILVLDADEEVPQSLQELIQAIVKDKAEPVYTADCYFIARKNMIFNNWLAHTGWWPDYQMRLFRKGTVSWSDGVHRLPDTSGSVSHLPAEPDLAIIHYNYQTVEQFLDRLNRYTTIKSKEARTGLALSEGEVHDRFGSAALFRTFSQELLSRLFAHHGSKDGPHGVSLSLLQSMYELVVRLKEWQAFEFASPSHHQEKELEGAIRDFQRQLNYWLANNRVSSSSGLAKLYWQIRRKCRI